MRPREAAVMPLPSEEVTPPVTNTNLGTGWTSGVFLILLRWRSSVQHGLASVGASADRSSEAARTTPKEQSAGASATSTTEVALVSPARTAESRGLSRPQRRRCGGHRGMPSAYAESCDGE